MEIKSQFSTVTSNIGKTRDISDQASESSTQPYIHDLILVAWPSGSFERPTT